MDKKRRNLVRSLALSPAILATGGILAGTENKSLPPTRLQYSINAYSFNSMLRSGEMTFIDMMEFAADIGMDAVDLTAYYFTSYPEIPENRELFVLKRKALELGLNIAWTGVRNDFVNPNAESRKSDIEMIRKWLTVSSRLGASIMRVFTGNHSYDGFTKDEVKVWLVDAFKTCASFGEEKGVMIALQNHHEFLFSSSEIIDILKRVNSEWFGLNLDTGSLHAKNPYQEIDKLAAYANYWFIKEHVYPNGHKTPVDMKKVASIIRNHGYRGYVSFESLSDEDPKQIIESMFNSFRTAFEGR